ncbi:MAG: hypothetical protein K5765_05115 [Clostridia bacterium]|nr:hypothetical protein [Clostridia bacterium]
MNNFNVEKYVGLAIKSGKVYFGVEKIELSKNTKLIVFSSNISKNSFEKLQKIADIKKIHLVSCDIEKIYPNRNCKAIGIVDTNLCKIIEYGVNNG